MKTEIAILLAICFICAMMVFNGGSYVDIDKPFKYHVVNIGNCSYLTFNQNKNSRGIIHNGDCRNKIHSIYGRVASHGESNKDVGVPVKDV